MSVSMARTHGVTVLTLSSDPQSACPPLCQILKGLCYSPVCCSVSQHLRRVQKTSQSVLGTLHIMVGLLNIGLGAILISSGGASSWDMDSSLFPFWFGGLFICFGITSILSEKYPSPCLVILNLFLNLAGVAFAIAAIVLYCINIASMSLWWMCHEDYWDYNRPTLSPHHKDIIIQKCMVGEAMVLVLAQSINAVLIVLSVLELCVAISSAVLGIKALKSSETKGNKSIDDPEQYKRLLEEVTTNPAV